MSLQEIIAEVEALSPQEVQALQAYLQTKVTQKAVLVGDLVGHLAGYLNDLPSDLSTNPKYMESFGK